MEKYALQTNHRIRPLPDPHFVSCSVRRAFWRTVGVTLLTTVVGCYESAPPPMAVIEAELKIGLPIAGGDTGDLRVQPVSGSLVSDSTAKSVSSKSAKQHPERFAFHAPLSVSAATARLAKLDDAGPSRDRMKWGLEQLHTHLQPPATSLRPGDVTFVQVSDPVPIPQLPSTEQQDVEIIDTPQPDAPQGVEPQPAKNGQNAIVPEMVPAPQGVPDVAETQPAGDKPEKLATTKMNRDNDSPKSESPSGGLKQVTDQGAQAIPADLKPEDYSTWAPPDVTLFVTGQQYGYIEPCGCTGLDKQKGGVARRFTFMKQLQDQGWDLIPIDAGNQVRRVGRQAAIKLSWSTEALKKMKYEAVGFGPDDMRLPATDLLQLAASDSPQEATYVSANVVLFDESYIPAFKIVQRGQHRLGITHILDPDSLAAGVQTDAEIKPIEKSAKAALDAMTQENATFKVLAFYGEEKSAAALAKAVPGFDLLIAAGGYGEPTYQPQAIEGSQTQMIVTGNKAMYAGLVGLYADQPFKYARVPLTHEFGDAPEMRKLMGEYQDHLKQIGFKELGLEPTPHLSGEKFVGTATCAQCHEEAFDVWSGSAHAHATESIVSPPEDRGDVPRHFDPECLSCHVTGWNPQGYYPYVSGYMSLEGSKHLHGNGCENCHGPGESHSKAERDDSGVSDEEKSRLRKSMQLPLERAKEQCMKCHDLDNSPDFHEPDAFEDIYWPEIEH